MLAGVEEIELRIEKLVAGGEGFGVWNGVPVFVPRSAPGDRVRARITERRAGYGRAEIVELLEAGEGRREPPCPHFGDCGGCDLQHLDEEHQLRWKSEATLETLRRLSRLALPTPRRIVAGAGWHYRLRTQVHTRVAEGRTEVGYHARGSHRLVPVASCAVLEPRLERALLALPTRLAPPVPARIDLAVGGDGAIATAPPLPGAPGGELVRWVAGHEYRYDARCFFQGHAGLLERLVDCVIGETGGEAAFDLYGGVGLFALPLAARHRRVVLVEGDRLAARHARGNAQRAHYPHLEIVARAVESWMPAGYPDAADRVVVDPPRDGLPFLVRRLLAARPARRLTYVSCHPAALARDLAELAPAYAVESIDLVDLFPQTGQMEVVVQMTSRGAA